MSTIQSPVSRTAQSLPPGIQQKLSGLRMRLMAWVAVDGLVWLLAAALVFAALDMVLDRFFKMDFAQRAIMLSLLSLGLLAIAIWRLVRPLMHSPTNDALILQVERKNPALRENLISSVQLHRMEDVTGRGMSAELVESTIEQGMRRAEEVPFASALDRQRGGLNLVLLTVLLLGLGGIAAGIASGNEFLKTWFNRNVLLQDELWPQNTYLVFPDAVDGVLTGTRGRDLRILVQVDPERSSIKDVDVELEIDNGQSRSRQPMKKAGETGEYQHVLLVRNVTSRFQIRARGGDETTSWVQVELVDEPEVTSMELTAVLPEYVGQLRERKLEGSGPHPVLRGSRLQVLARVNKKLSVANLVLAGNSVPLEQVDELTYRIELPVAGEGELEGGKYVFDLADEAGKTSDRPAAFSIKIRDDKPPLVRASLNGISGLIVPKAVLPFSFSAADEFKLTRLGFKYSYVAGDGAVPVDKEVGIPLEFPVGQEHQRSTEQLQRLDLRPDGIPVGTTFRLNILAWDNQPTEDGTIVDPGQSREFLLRVVTEDELREDLLRREVEQRGAFEQAYANQLDLQAELRALAAALPEKAEDPEAQQRVVARFFEEREAKLLAHYRRQKIIGTNVIAVADRFRSFMIEAENNRLDENLEGLGGEIQEEIATRSLKERFGNEIVEPIVQLDQNQITAAFQGIDACRRVSRNPERFAEQVKKTAEVQEQILQEMTKILRAMEQSESFQQIVNGLIKVKVAEEGVGQEVGKAKEQDDVLPDFFDKIDGGDGNKDEGGN